MINYVYEQELRKVFIDHTKGFKTLLQNNNDACNYHRNVQTLLIEISKKKKGFASSVSLTTSEILMQL